MPAEWEPHEATWIAWPHERSDWPGRFDGVRWTYTEIVRRLGESERVEILVQDSAHERSARRTLRAGNVDLTAVRFWSIPTDRSWLRDSGPTFVRRTRAPFDLLGLQWKFNAWAKYDNWRADRQVSPAICRAARTPSERARIGSRWLVLEGGAFDVDGHGLLVATEECLLDRTQGRNPGLDRRAVERALRANLGVEDVLWLPKGIAGDDTHGHVDDIARFVAPGRLVVVRPADRADIDRSASDAAFDALADVRPHAGRRLRLDPLPAPEPVLVRGQRLPASYANFYIANRTVLVPTFDDPADSAAIAILAGAFPGRRVVGIRSRDLVWGLGTLHCLTQQQPIAHAP